MIAAFGGTFTGVFAALIKANCPVDYAATKALEVANTVKSDFPDDPNGVVTPWLIGYDQGVLTVNYESRSGNEYVFILSKYDWYDNEIQYPENSSLCAEFERIGKEWDGQRAERAGGSRERY